MDTDKIINFFARDRYAALAGIKILRVEPGYAMVEMEIEDKHLNAADIIQGGAIFTMADFAFAVASNAGGQVTLSVNANITYFKSATGRKLIAEAQEVSGDNKLIGYNVDVTDENNDLTARISIMGYRKKERMPFWISHLWEQI
jgi:acyl-CoA thioesterase